MYIYDLGHVAWLDSQLLYHAMPRLGLEGILILAPAEPYVCIGYHQDLAQEVDEAYCQEHRIPIFRREVGGGAVYLDGKQLFYQIILHRESPLLQGDRTTFYRRMLQPVADTYGDLGVPAHYRPVNDIVTDEGRKISGNGVAEIGDYVVLVGNLIADFDYQTMARVLRVPDEKYRDKVFRSMQENLTTLKRELGREPDWQEMSSLLMRRYEGLFGPLEPAALPDAVYEMATFLQRDLLDADWLHKKGKKHPGRDVRIASGVNVVQRLHKAPGGLLRATVEIADGRLVDVSLSGDLFCYPREGIRDLEGVLGGTPLSDVGAVLRRFYAEGRMESPGVGAEDWLKVLVG